MCKIRDIVYNKRILLSHVTDAVFAHALLFQSIELFRWYILLA